MRRNRRSRALESGGPARARRDRGRGSAGAGKTTGAATGTSATSGARSAGCCRVKVPGGGAAKCAAVQHASAFTAGPDSSPGDWVPGADARAQQRSKLAECICAQTK